MEVAALACYCTILQVSLECAARIRGLAVYPLISNEVLGYDAAESASKMSYNRLPRFWRCTDIVIVLF